MELTHDTLRALAAAFDPDCVGYLARASQGNQALAMPYIEARDVMARLDAVVGPAQWEWRYELLEAEGRRVKGILTVCGITREDAGEAAQETEPLKSAVSDALKRCGVHFGIGRYLYYLPMLWHPYDQQRKRWQSQPGFPPAVVARAVSIACGDPVLPLPPTAPRVEAERPKRQEQRRPDRPPTASAEPEAPAAPAKPNSLLNQARTQAIKRTIECFPDLQGDEHKPMRRAIWALALQRVQPIPDDETPTWDETAWVTLAGKLHKITDGAEACNRVRARAQELLNA